jgi:hypothetical protein
MRARTELELCLFPIRARGHRARRRPFRRRFFRQQIQRRPRDGREPFVIPNFRLKATDKTVTTFGERAAEDPQAIRAWFYPGDNWGQEFVYPKKRAIELAKIANVPVLYIPEEVAPNIVLRVKTATEPAVIALEKAPVMAVKPTEEIVPLTEVVEPAPLQTARLATTGSDLPLLALLGFLCLGAGISLRQLCPR